MNVALLYTATFTIVTKHWHLKPHPPRNIGHTHQIKQEEVEYSPRVSVVHYLPQTVSDDREEGGEMKRTLGGVQGQPR